jgi:hypothetical protein
MVSIGAAVLSTLAAGDDASFAQLQSLRQKDDPLEFSVGRWPSSRQCVDDVFVDLRKRVRQCGPRQFLGGLKLDLGNFNTELFEGRNR